MLNPGGSVYTGSTDTRVLCQEEGFRSLLPGFHFPESARHRNRRWRVTKGTRVPCCLSTEESFQRRAQKQSCRVEPGAGGVSGCLWACQCPLPAGTSSAPRTRPLVCSASRLWTQEDSSLA